MATNEQNNSENLNFKPNIRTFMTPDENNIFNIDFLTQKKKPDDDIFIDNPSFKFQNDFEENKEFKISPFLKQIGKKLINATKFRKPEKLKSIHYEIINDNANFYHSENRDKSKKVINFVNCFKKYFTHNNSIFHPYSTFRILWNFLIHIFISFIFLFIPMEMALYEYFDYYILLNIHILATYLFLFDFLISFNSCYFENGFLIANYKKIIRHYFRGFLFCDVVSNIAVAIPLFLDFEIAFYISICVYFKIFKYIWLSENISRILKLDAILKGYMDIIRILIMSLLIIHLISCFWIVIGDHTANGPHWILKGESMSFNFKTWEDKYLLSLYWAVVTMMTVGYGDITPTNKIEVIYTSIVILFGCVVYGYNLNTIGIVLEEMYKEAKIFKNNSRIIKNFMQRKNIGYDLKMRIEEYLKFIWKEKKDKNLELEINIINSLSSTLKEELLLEAYGGLLLAYPMFYANFTEKSLKKMISKLKEVTFTHEENIYSRGDLDDCSLYFINQGVIKIFLNDDEIPLKNLTANEAFGEIEFFNPSVRSYSAKSVGFSNVFVLKREEFMEIIKQNSLDYERFCMIRDQISFYDYNPSLFTRCFACNSKQHSVFNCNLLHYIPDKEKIIKTYEFNYDQKRSSSYRRKLHKQNSMKLIKSIHTNQKKFIDTISKEKENNKLIALEKILKKNLNQFDSEYFRSDNSLSFNEETENETLDHNSNNMLNYKFFKINLILLSSKDVYSINKITEENEDENNSIFEKENSIDDKNEESKKSENIENNGKNAKNEKIEKNENYEKIEKNEKNVKNEKIEKIEKNDEKSDEKLKRKDFDKIKSNIHTTMIDSVTKYQTKIDSITNPKLKDEPEKINNDREFNLYFESYKNFINYFPEGNIKIQLKTYERKRKKLFYLKELKDKTFGEIDKTDYLTSDIYKKAKKYSFYYPNFQIIKPIKKDKKEIGNDSPLAKSQIKKKSSFFEKKNFLKKISFTEFVSSLVSNLKKKKKKIMKKKIRC